MLTVSCAKDATNDLTANGPATVLEMNIENGDDARTSLGADGYAVLWSKGDRVAVNGVQTTIADEFDGAQSATFKVSGVVAPYKVLYPADVLNEDNTITVSEIQNYAPDSFAQGAAVMVGYSESTTVQVKNLYGLVKLTVAKSGDELIKSVTLHSNNLEAMTGTFAVDYAEAAIEPLAGMDFVKVVAADGIAYNDEGKAVIYIALPAGTYAQGFTVKVATDKGTMSKKMSKSLTLERSKIYTLPELAFKANTDEAIEITDAATLQAFLTAVNNGDYKAYVAGNGEVQLGADIDMTGVTITPAKSFDGVFNGRGYKLKNWTAENGLFAVNSGTIKNIVLDESCNLTIPEAGGDTGFIATTNSGIVSGCTNNATITYDKASSAVRHFGAIVGSSTGIVANCTNNGDITFNFTSVTANNFVGGVVGYTDTNTDGTITVNKCINNGNININTKGTPKYIYLGGVVGAGKVAMVSKITVRNIIANCINNGNIDYSYTVGKSGTYANVGGVAGFVPGSIQNCENNGNVTFAVPETAASTRPAIAGVAGCVIYSASDCVNRGVVTVSGMFAAGSYDTTDKTVPIAGAGGSVQPQFGGIVASLGKHLTDDTQKMENCINYGTIDYKLFMVNTGGTAPRYGGLVGFCTVNIANCRNYGDIKVTSNHHTNHVGGIVGESRLTVSDCQNDGTITYSVDASKLETAKPTLILGGIVGTAKNEVANCTNNCKLEINTIATINHIGGVIGNAVKGIATCTNNGPMVVDLMNSTTQQYIAGIVGYINNTDAINIENCTNYASIDVKNGKNTTTFNYVGGISGNNAKNNLTFSECINKGKLTTNCEMKTRLGGVCGAHSGTMKACENHATITMNGATANEEKDASGIGGLAGHIGTSVSGCKSTGTVINNSDAGSLTGGLFGSVGNTKRTWSDNTVECDITTADGTFVGILLGGQIGVTDKLTTVGSTAKPIKVSSKTTINGTAVTAEDCAESSKLVGSITAKNFLKIVSVTFVQ